MSLESINRLVAPPLRPLFPGDATSWEAVQARLGVRLPSCLDAFAKSYGSGWFEGASYPLYIYNPHDPNYDSDFECMRLIYTGLKEEYPEYYPYDFYPAARGLFPVGHGWDAIAIYFLPESNTDPDKYTVVLKDGSVGFSSYPGMSIFEFVYRFLRNEMLSGPYFLGELKFIQAPMLRPM